MSWLLWIVLLWTLGGHVSFWIIVFSSTCPEVGLLNHIVTLFLVFWGTSILFSTVAVPTYVPTNSVEGFLFSTPSPAFIICKQNYFQYSRTKTKTQCECEAVGDELNALWCILCKKPREKVRYILLTFMTKISETHYNICITISVAGSHFCKGKIKQVKTQNPNPMCMHLCVHRKRSGKVNKLQEWMEFKVYVVVYLNALLYVLIYCNTHIILKRGARNNIYFIDHCRD